MFATCSYLTGAGLSTWTVTSPKQLPWRMDYMFENCYELGNETPIDMSSHAYNGSGGNWDYTMVSTMLMTFSYCRYLGRESSFRMNGCNLVNLTWAAGFSHGHQLHKTFYLCFGYNVETNYIVGNATVELKHWNIAGIASDTTTGIRLDYMFNGCTRFDPDLTGWTITDPVQMNYMFVTCHYLTGTGLSTWTIASPKQLPWRMDYMFQNCYDFKEPISHWDVTLVNNFTSFGSNANAHTSLFSSSSQNYFLAESVDSFAGAEKRGPNYVTTTSFSGYFWTDVPVNVNVKPFRNGPADGLYYIRNFNAFQLKRQNAVEDLLVSNGYLIFMWVQKRHTSYLPFINQSPLSMWAASDGRFMNITGETLTSNTWTFICIHCEAGASKFKYYYGSRGGELQDSSYDQDTADFTGTSISSGWGNNNTQGGGVDIRSHDMVVIQGDYTRTDIEENYFSREYAKEEHIPIHRLHFIEIVSLNNYTKDGETISYSNNFVWDHFEIMRFDPSSFDFNTQEYMIEWEDDPVNDIHQGYFFTYDNGQGITSDSFIREGGPIWWWYSGQTTIKPYESAYANLGIVPSSAFADSTVWNAFRKKNRVKFKFISDNQVQWTWIISGIEHSYTAGTYGAWTFSSKTSIELRYHTYSHNGFTQPHNFTIYKILE